MRRESCWILCCPPTKVKEGHTLEPIAKPVQSVEALRRQSNARGGRCSYKNTVDSTAKARQQRQLSPATARRQAQSEITPWEVVDVRDDAIKEASGRAKAA